MSLLTILSPIDQNDRIDSIDTKSLDLHNCLSDNADWNDEYWDFDIECLKSFIKLIQSLYQESTKGIEFQAIWAGDKPNKIVKLSIEELVTLLESNKIKTTAKYVVHKT